MRLDNRGRIFFPVLVRWLHEIVVKAQMQVITGQKVVHTFTGRLLVLVVNDQRSVLSINLKLGGRNLPPFTRLALTLHLRILKSNLTSLEAPPRGWTNSWRSLWTIKHINYRRSLIDMMTTIGCFWPIGQSYCRKNWSHSVFYESRLNNSIAPYPSFRDSRRKK